MDPEEACPREGGVADFSDKIMRGISDLSDFPGHVITEASRSIDDPTLFWP
jgi:hypothetical protein